MASLDAACLGQTDGASVCRPHIPRTYVCRVEVMGYRFVRKNGEFNVERKGVGRAVWNDLYHWLIRIQWRYFLLGLFLAYFGINAGFAALYWVQGDCIAGAEPGSFSDAFFFSIQSMATIGYGAMYPKTFAADMLVALESFVGLLFTAISTGQWFGQF